MKRNILFAGTVILMLVMFNACSKDDKVRGRIDNNYFEVEIDGNKRSFTDVSGRWIDGGNFLELTATNDGGEWISITVMSDETRVPAGVYELDDNKPFKMLSTYSLIGASAQKNYTATDNTIAIEDAFVLDLSKINNSEAEGTFSGTLVSVEGYTTISTVTLTNGKFKMAIDPN